MRATRQRRQLVETRTAERQTKKLKCTKNHHETMLPTIGCLVQPARDGHANTNGHHVCSTSSQTENHPQTHLQSKEQHPNLNHSQRESFVLLELPGVQVACHHKVPNADSHHQVYTDLVAQVNGAGRCSDAESAHGLHCQEDTLVHCKANSFSDRQSLVQELWRVLSACACALQEWQHSLLVSSRNEIHIKQDTSEADLQHVYYM